MTNEEINAAVRVILDGFDLRARRDSYPSEEEAKARELLEAYLANRPVRQVVFVKGKDY
jgi:hypothetical protein